MTVQAVSEFPATAPEQIEHFAKLLSRSEAQAKCLQRSLPWPAPITQDSSGDWRSNKVGREASSRNRYAAGRKPPI